MKNNARTHLTQAWSHYTELMAERAEGIYIYAANGRCYLDFTSGIGVINTGHCHPVVVAAAQEQIAK
ncbi:MAG: aminotransferase class III-fold pyridoxal phosphate-dependent enzyme, partial [Anaerolineales bacterium]|nr:aminotransferase class III-fold pyridoxal phosphate-dependent enzyme [Anaerolineales bacterium]